MNKLRRTFWLLFTGQSASGSMCDVGICHAFLEPRRSKFLGLKSLKEPAAPTASAC